MKVAERLAEKRRKEKEKVNEIESEKKRKNQLNKMAISLGYNKFFENVYE